MRRPSPLDSLTHVLRYLRAGFVVLDHDRGAVLAWVGGPDFTFDQYDHVTSKRQVGSTFKPFVYAAALQSGYDPCYYLDNSLRSYGKAGDQYTPRNANHEYGGSYSMHGALSHSVNTAAVRMTDKVGVEKVVATARKLGLTSELPPILGIALGTAEASLLEMTSAYGTFPAGGLRHAPHLIDRIETADGHVIYRYEDKADRVLSPVQSAQVLQMLKFVVDRGTANRLRWQYNVLRPSAGKTGTTQNGADGWYIGATPELTGGVWVGGVNAAIRFKSGNNGNGSRSALPIWADFLKRVEADTALGGAVLGDDFPTLTEELLRADFYCAEFIPPDSTEVDYYEYEVSPVAGDAGEGEN